MSSEELRKRLEALNGGPLKTPLPEVKSASPVEVKTPKKRKTSGTPRTQAAALEVAPIPLDLNAFPAPLEAPEIKKQTRPSRNDAPFVSLEQAVPGKETVSPLGSPYYAIEVPVERIEPNAERYHHDFLRLFPPHSAKVGQFCCVPHATAEKTLFLDLETSGLHNAPIFLIGTILCENGTLVARQYFARSYSEEAAILSSIVQTMRDTHLLVTYNGRSFDVPYLQMRAAAMGLRWFDADGHVDLLPVSRRAFKKQLPNCKLQTLERYVCGRFREDDIPGSEIPAAYHRFTKTLNAYQIQSILEHNLHDMVTMVSLISYLFGKRP